PATPQLVFAVAPGHADRQFVLPLAVERPVMLAHDLLDEVERIEPAGGLGFDKSPHALALPLCGWPVCGGRPKTDCRDDRKALGQGGHRINPASTHSAG